MILTTVELTWSGVKIHPIAGRYFRLLETVNPVTVEFGRGNQFYNKLENVEAGAWARIKDGDAGFTHLKITTQGSEEVKFVVADGEAGYDRLFTAFAQARALTLPGNASVGVAASVVLAAATRSKLIFMADAGNAGSIALGPLGVTMANSPILLGPGDSWVEELAASAEWRAISDTAAQTLRILWAA